MREFWEWLREEFLMPCVVGLILFAVVTGLYILYLLLSGQEI